jgi:hypothetical protein
MVAKISGGPFVAATETDAPLLAADVADGAVAVDDNARCVRFLMMLKLLVDAKNRRMGTIEIRCVIF